MGQLAQVLVCLVNNVLCMFYLSILGVVSCVYIAIIVTIKYFLIHNNDHYFSCARPQHLSRSELVLAIGTVAIVYCIF